MADLIAQILNNSLKKISAFTDLNSLLKNPDSFQWRNPFSHKGMGSDYSQIVPYLTVNADEIISDIDSRMVLKLAGEFLGENNKKQASKAGICFALVAIYSPDIKEKFQACNALVDLFSPQGFLPNPALLAQCYEMLKLAKADGNFYSTQCVLHAWFSLDPKDVLSFEQKRQKAIASGSELTLKDALSILGLSVSPHFDTDEIKNISQTCKTQLRMSADLSLKQAKEDSTYRALSEMIDKSAELLEDYVCFVNFDWNQRNKVLTEAITSINSYSFSNRNIYSDILKSFKEYHREMRSVVRIGSHPDTQFVTQSLIVQKLGGLLANNWLFSSQRAFVYEDALKNKAKEFWNHITQKISTVIDTRYVIIYYNDINANKDLEKIHGLIEEIEHAIFLLTQIKGTALEESTLVSDAAIDVQEKLDRLQILSSNLQGKIDSFATTLNTSVVEASSLCTLKSEPAVSIADRISLISITYPDLLGRIEDKLIWLNGLQGNLLLMVEEKFKSQIVRQASIEDAADAIAKELSKVDSNALEKAFKGMGISYSKFKPLKDNILGYLKPRKDQDMQQIAATLIGELKSALLNQNISVSLKGNVLPAPESMSVRLVTQHLKAQQEAIRVSQNALSGQLNSELKSALEVLKVNYAQIDEQIVKISQEKGSLDYSWQQSVVDLQSAYPVWKEKCNKLLAQIPDDYETLSGLSPEVKNLVLDLKEKESTSTQKLDNFYQKITKVSYDTFRYKALKNVLKMQRNTYLENGVHHADRTASLERLSHSIDGLDNLGTGERFSSLIKAIKDEAIATATSHQKIGFLGHFRYCRLQRVYESVLEQAKKWEITIDDVPALSEDGFRYSLLKKRIQVEEKLYKEKGRHHQDRINSLERLNKVINEIDTGVFSGQECFDKLLSAVKTEKAETNSSHQRVGYLSRPCRLEMMYTSILDEVKFFVRNTETAVIDDAAYFERKIS